MSDSACALELTSTEVSEWEAEDEILGVLGEGMEQASGEQAGSMLDEIVLSLPDQLYIRNLMSDDSKTAMVTDKVAPDFATYDYTLVGVPLGILVPPPRRLHRLRLRVAFDVADGSAVAAFDVFPPDQWVSHDVISGEVSLDVSKALQFVCPGPLSQIASEALGLKLKVPFGWTAHSARVQTTGPMTNPLHWYITDEEIAGSFCGYLVMQRSRPSKPFTIRAEVLGEIRRRGLAGAPIVRTFFRGTPAPDHDRYTIPRLLD
jgi:hypothetical protein